MAQAVLLSTAYLPSVFYLKQILQHEIIVLEKFEYFEKQTYRNRCDITNANGRLSLSIPLIKQKTKELIFEKKISYAEDWQKNHWRTLVSAYNNSPYFDFFQHEIKPLYHTQCEYLFEFNFQLIETILRILRIKKDIRFTQHYQPIHPDITDFRKTINMDSLKMPFEFKPYYQVFSNKIPFQKNLSCIDALFNIGLELKHL
jgi:hypothetical protein